MTGVGGPSLMRPSLVHQDGNIGIKIQLTTMFRKAHKSISNTRIMEEKQGWKFPGGKKWWVLPEKSRYHPIYSFPFILSIILSVFIQRSIISIIWEGEIPEIVNTLGLLFGVLLMVLFWYLFAFIYTKIGVIEQLNIDSGNN